MKYPMENPSYRTMLGLLLPLISVSIIFCAQPNVIEVPNEEAQAAQLKIPKGKGSPEYLRLTYDLAFRPPPGYKIEEKGSLYGKGNFYKIRFPIELNGFEYLKISSTNSANSSLFEYEITKKDLEKAKWRKYFYLPVQGNLKSATIALFSFGLDIICVRWEWIYNDYLIVFESSGKFSEKDINPKQVAENYHQIIEKHLSVY